MTVKTTTRQTGDVTIVDLAGRVTVGAGAIALSETIRQLVAAGSKKLLINLADLAYIDSSGVGELVASLTVVTKQGGAMKLLSPSKRVAELLHITHIDALFEIFDSEEAAVRSFS